MTPGCSCRQCARAQRRTENHERRKAGLLELPPIEGPADPLCACEACEKKRLRALVRRRQPSDEELDRRAAEWLAEH